MSSPNKSVSPAQDGGSNPADDKPRLTEEEKKQNHIASGRFHPSHVYRLPVRSIPLSVIKRQLLTGKLVQNKTRRQAIREGFDRLTELVPGLEGQGRSEGIVLKKTVVYMREQLEERRELIRKIEENGGQVDDGLKR